MQTKPLAMTRILRGYNTFRDKFASGDASVMQKLAYHGQKPQLLIVGCCDSRVDPSVILQSEPGELFIVRNVANIVPTCDADKVYRNSTMAALEFGICHLNIPNLVLWGHSQCGGIQAMLDKQNISSHDEYISHWMSLITSEQTTSADDVDSAAKRALILSYANCLSFPWIQERIAQNRLAVHRWFFDISKGQLLSYSDELAEFIPL